MLILKLHHIPYLMHCKIVLYCIVMYCTVMNQLYLSDSWAGDKTNPSTKDDSNKNSHFIE